MISDSVANTVKSHLVATSLIRPPCYSESQIHFPYYYTIVFLLQVFAIEFVAFAIEFVPFAIEFVGIAIEFVPFAIEFVGFAIEFVGFAVD